MSPLRTTSKQPFVPVAAQGSLFVKLQNFIMGDEYGNGHPQTRRSELEEVDGKAMTTQI